MNVIQFPNFDSADRYERECGKGAEMAEAAIATLRATGNRPAFARAFHDALAAPQGVKVGFLDRIAAALGG